MTRLGLCIRLRPQLVSFAFAGAAIFFASGVAAGQSRASLDGFTAGVGVDCSTPGGRAVLISDSFARNAPPFRVFPIALNNPAAGGVLVAQIPGGPANCATGAAAGALADACCVIVSNQAGGGGWLYTPNDGNPAASELRFLPSQTYTSYGSCVYRVFSRTGTPEKPIYVASSTNKAAVCLRPVAVDDIDLAQNTFEVGEPIEIEVFANDIVGNDGDATPEISDFLLLEFGPLLTEGPNDGPIVFTVGQAEYVPPTQQDPRLRIRITPGFTGCGVGEVRYRLVAACREAAQADGQGDIFSAPADYLSNPATVRYRVVDPNAPDPVAQNDAPAPFALGSQYLVPILGNDNFQGAAADLQVQVLGGATGGSFTYVPPAGQVPGHLRFTPSFSTCGTGTCSYTLTDACGNTSAPANVSVSIALGVADCDANCIPDSEQPDCDENGIPDSCDGPCGDCNINRRNPGSLLLFPVFDDRAEVATLGVVTNAHVGGAPGPGGLLAGTVDVEFIFIRRYGLQNQDLGCTERNVTRRLTPNDTYAFLTRYLNPDPGRGFYYAFAKSPINGKPIVFNHLLGSTLTFGALDSTIDSVNAVTFRGIGAEGALTDHDLDGVRDLDGDEYDTAPGEILIPRFLGQDPPGAGPGIRSRLVMIGLTGGTQFNTTVMFHAFNDNEQLLSANKTFRCWDDSYLTDINNLFRNSYLQDSTNHDLDEVFGANERESGWIRIKGTLAFSTATQINDPVVYAVLFENGANYTTASLPFEGCGNPNGDLLPTGVHGDP